MTCARAAPAECTGLQRISTNRNRRDKWCARQLLLQLEIALSAATRRSPPPSGQCFVPSSSSEPQTLNPKPKP